MTRPKGSLKPVPKPKPEPRDDTLRDLRAMAKQRGVKIRDGMRYAEVRDLLGLPPKDYPKRYDHCKESKPPQAMIMINVNTGEETRFSSIFKTAVSLGKFAGSVTYSMKVGRPIVKDGISYTFRRVE